ncbi:TDP-N-acetylfucosamine:lipid II N-acetylfucosaminyltransferase [Thalassotalea marina]|uniref:4-alpha-L-fucosyltransferase n=1 Tax=Thalassotalea marina TaxID=1673741 RepID=A0A919BDJ5_9GAMM|nr:TDP-N-acetylfucosamine:lipid II N-acetylfucosaminyltransferase [Thalassotalea marina]GHF80925.1 hypothetical protein GCM10017161_05300 [Thalassotalea marina]
MKPQPSIIHIFDGNPHHYIPMQGFLTSIEQINVKQQFWVRKVSEDETLELPFEAKTYRTGRELVNEMQALHKSTRFVFHGLFDLNGIASKFLYRAIAKRCSCVLWGAELYRHSQEVRGVKQKLAKVIHSIVLNRFDRVFALNTGDAQLAVNTFGKPNVGVLPYPLISNDFVFNPNGRDNISKPVHILVGNSAAPSNEHTTLLQLLRPLASEDIIITAPLNYGADKDYVEKICQLGNEIFGEKFTAITHMLNKKSYDNLLNTVDGAVLGHKRQQGLYVVYAMLQMGKPVFLRSDTSSFENLSALEFELNDTIELDKTEKEKVVALFSKLNARNATLFEQNYTIDALSPKWADMINSLFTV